MSRALPENPFLMGTYAPWPMEGEIRDLIVEGEIPAALSGTLYRNGPNPQFAPRGNYHWFDGDGMIHAFFFRDGKVDYKNRWVRTERFRQERAAGEALFAGLASAGSADPRVDGKSPAEYIVDPTVKESVRSIARDILLGEYAKLDDMMALVDGKLRRSTVSQSTVSGEAPVQG